MKKIGLVISTAFFTIFMILMLTVSASATEISGSCGDNATWTFNTNTGEMSVSGYGAMAYYSEYYFAPWKSYSDEIKLITIEQGITAIGSYAFDNCAAEQVIIPDSVTYIGFYAFKGCYNLKEIVIPDSVISAPYAFNNCNLESMTVPYIDNGLYYYFEYSYVPNEYVPSTLKKVVVTGGTTINQQAFQGCESIETIVLPDSITSIEWAAFSGCANLKNINIPNGLSSLGEDAFNNCPNIEYTEYDNAYYLGNNSNPYVVLVSSHDKNIFSCEIANGTVFINSEAFKDCTNLFDITIPEDVKSIGSSAFENCSTLMKIHLPDTVTEIQQYAFNGCSSLDEIVIPDGITYISMGAFADCSEIKNLTLPKSIDYIGYGAFQGSTVMNVHISDLSAWCNITFADEYANPCHYSGRLLVNGSPITDLVIPDGVVKITSNMFGNASNVTSITIPSSVTTIGAWGFSSFIGLKEIVIPENVTTIESYAFSGCSNLQTVIIKGEIVVLEESVFLSCYNLSTVSLPDSLKLIKKYAFSYCNSLKNIAFCGEDWDSVVKIDDWVISSGDYEVIDHIYTELRSVDQDTHIGSCANCQLTAVLPHIFNEGFVKAPATHTEKGVLVYTCACGETKNEYMDIISDHSWSEDCTYKDGKDVYVCTICNATNETAHIHQWVSYFGIEICNLCGETSGEIITPIIPPSSIIPSSPITPPNFNIEIPSYDFHVHNFGVWEDVQHLEHSRICECGEIEIGKHVYSNGETVCAVCGIEKFTDESVASNNAISDALTSEGLSEPSESEPDEKADTKECETTSAQAESASAYPDSNTNTQASDTVQDGCATMLTGEAALILLLFLAAAAVVSKKKSH